MQPTHPTLAHPTPRILTILVALAIVPTTGCFDPRVVADTEDGTEDGATTDATDGAATEAMTTVDPDSDSGEPPAVCGDGVVEGSEVCDDGVNDGSYGGCNADCSAPGPFCGDGVVNGGEPCDDGDDVDGNGCNVDCVVSGSVLWTVTYDGPERDVDQATAVAVDSADNVVVVGRTHNDGVSAIWVAKYTPDGREAWSTAYCPAGGSCFAYDVATTADDEIIVAGLVDAGDGNQDAWVRRYDADGDIVWTHTHDGPTGGTDTAHTVTTDENGNAYVVIRENQVDIGNGIVDIIRKYSPDGAELWSIPQPPANRIDDFARLASGNFLIASREGTNEFWTPLLQEMNPDGGIVWQETNDAYAPGWYEAVDVNSEGDIAASITLQDMNNDALVMRLTSEREEVWSDIPWGSQSTTKSVTIDESGWLSCTGSAGQDGTLWTRKYQPAGVPSWTDTYNGQEALLGFDQGEDIVRDSMNNIIVVGSVQDTEETVVDAWIRKYAP